jgi:hypothetical protein
MWPGDPGIDSGHPSFGSSHPYDLPTPNFAHLRTMTDRFGLWEHASGPNPRPEHGFTTDDNARGLIVVSRQASISGGLSDLAATYLGFVLEAGNDTGVFHNRRSARGDWTDDIGSDDCQGRAWWALGTVARLGATDRMRQAGHEAFANAASFGSTHLRSNAYAVLGAAEVLDVDPHHAPALELLTRCTRVITDATHEMIPWPETRLTYDNSRIPEALMAAGSALDDPRLTTGGIRMLEWLVRTETNGDHFSFTPAFGCDLDQPRPVFDQQPIESWAMAEACYRAYTLTRDVKWRERAIRAARWLIGDNDTGDALYDPETGATGDGLTPDSVSINQGAESTLSGLAALQIALLCTVDTTPRPSEN